MRKIEIELTLGIGYQGATHEDSTFFDVEDNATDKEIQDIAEDIWLDWSNNYIDGGPRVVSDTKIEE